MTYFFSQSEALSKITSLCYPKQMKTWANSTKLKFTILFVIGIYNPILILAQEYTTQKVESEGEIMHVLPVDERYRFDHFQSGKVFFNDGNTVNATLNYNFLNQEIEFINTVGDTLSIAQRNAVNRIKIGQQLFYHYPTVGYLEVCYELPTLKLVVQRVIQPVRNQRSKVIPHRLNSDDNSLNSTSALGNNESSLTLLAKRNYFFVDKNKRLYPSQRSSLYRIFPQHRTIIKDYLKRYRINLEQEEDIIKVLQFCSQTASG